MNLDGCERLLSLHSFRTHPVGDILGCHKVWFWFVLTVHFICFLLCLFYWPVHPFRPSCFAKGRQSDFFVRFRDSAARPTASETVSGLIHMEQNFHQLWRRISTCNLQTCLSSPCLLVDSVSSKCGGACVVNAVLIWCEAAQTGDGQFAICEFWFELMKKKIYFLFKCVLQRAFRV
jgi:hypothetical protein